MRILFLFLLLVIVCQACDHQRLYEKNNDFRNRSWVVSEKPAFDFDIEDTESTYNLFITIRNEADYPNANIYFTYYLSDSTGTTFEKSLKSEFLFDRKTGRPLGKSGIGYVYEHKFPILEGYTFSKPGTYTMRFEQFMRVDSLPGILSVGLRVEKAQ
ncbi:MAG: gliding motility lipoprotein GldH [Cyclobacteriaceae bacterium]|nr:gliding motility lipoprotein GldH [Cyclobacteriaceae bacterium]